MWQLELGNPLEELMDVSLEEEITGPFLKGDVIHTTNEIRCTTCGRITQWYEFWNAGDCLEVAVYCPACRLNFWMEDNYGFSIYPEPELNEFDFYFDLGEEDLGYDEKEVLIPDE